MKWRRERQEQKPPQQQKKKSLSATFALWISKLKQLGMKPKKSRPEMPSHASRSGCFKEPKTRAGSVSDYISYTPDALDRLSAQSHEPRRVSVGEDETELARARVSQSRRRTRSERHKSVGELDLRPLASAFETPVFRRDLGIQAAIERPENDHAGISRQRRRRCGRTATAERTAVSRSPPPHLNSIRDARDPERTGETRRRSISRKGRRRTRPKIRVCSPRPSAGRGKAPTAEGEMGRGLERFAVVKCSCDPQKDFRESMVEMIWEKGIGRPEELESLLACYLSLNSDEHHDVIVKVFRQVWFELNPERFASQYCCCRRVNCRGC